VCVCVCRPVKQRDTMQVIAMSPLILSVEVSRCQMQLWALCQSSTQMVALDSQFLLVFCSDVSSRWNHYSITSCQSH